MRNGKTAVVRGGGDLATGIIYRLWRVGYSVLALETALPLVVRRTVSVASAVFDGRAKVEDMSAVLIGSMKEYDPASDVIQVLVDPEGLDTYASCARARDEFGAHRLTVISQRYHLPRALVICRLLGLDAWGVGDTSVADRSPRTWTHGARREVAANLKVLWDVAGHRPWLRGKAPSAP